MLLLPALVTYSDDFTINVDNCVPLPCEYGSITIPTAASTVLPNEVFVYTNGTVSIDSWSEYRDDVSIRCSPEGTYGNMCGAKNYEITAPDKSALPFTVTVSFNSLTNLYELHA